MVIPYNSQQTILIVEDEPAIADALTYSLKNEHFNTVWIQLGSETLDAISSYTPALIILDIGLPDQSGFDVCKSVRKTTFIPILFLTARTEEVDKILGFELGADDYVSKPFSPREVVSRVKAILRRTGHEPLTEHSEQTNLVTMGAIEWCPESRTVLFHNQDLLLTRYEYGILTLFLQHPKRIYTREQILSLVWTEDNASLDRVIDTHIKSLRAKLRDIDPTHELITTHRGVGYSLN